MVFAAGADLAGRGSHGYRGPVLPRMPGLGNLTRVIDQTSGINFYCEPWS